MKTCTLSNIVIFAAGAALGSAVSWRLLKTKYERIAQEEIDSVKEVFSRRNKKEDEDQSTEKTEPTDKDWDEYVETVENLGYQTEKGGPKPVKPKDPYVISPEEFGELDSHETVSLTYYADGVLTDEYDEVIDDIDELVGEDSLNHFGEYEDDSVFVRNEKKSIDYEILFDSRKYSEIKRAYYSKDSEE